MSHPSAPWTDPGAFPAGTASDGKITRAEVIRRAKTWVAEGVPYSQSAWWTDANGTYRQDCSGYVSMAWHLDQNTNYWTGNLATVSQPIKVETMQPGDILLSTTHTLIFAGWSDPAHATFALYEQFAPGFTARYSDGASMASYLADDFVPYRYNGIADAGDAVLVPAALSKALPMLPAPAPLVFPAFAGGQGQARGEAPYAPDVAPASEPIARIAYSSALSPSPLVAAACAGLLACFFPLVGLTAPLRRSVRRPRVLTPRRH